MFIATLLNEEFMLEHFASQTSNEIQGKARAMVVTRSRLHAVRFKRKFDELMREMRLPYGALVAFSGSVYDEDTGETYTESSMNNLGGNIDIPDAFKLPKYRILIVAEKYQTGFDEPLLHTMFVDKKLAKEGAVQTLSRLNRTCAGKNSTMVLDFVNNPDDIRDAFQSFYGTLFMNEEDETDPNSLYDLKSRIRDFDVLDQADIDEFAKYFYVDDSNKENVYGVLYRAVEKAKAKLDDDNMTVFRKTCRQFTNLYKFLSQIITFKDVELDKLYVFLVALIKMLPYKVEEMPKNILNETGLDSYKVQYQFRAQNCKRSACRNSQQTLFKPRKHKRRNATGSRSQKIRRCIKNSRKSHCAKNGIRHIIQERFYEYIFNLLLEKHKRNNAHRISYGCHYSHIFQKKHCVIHLEPPHFLLLLLERRLQFQFFQLPARQKQKACLKL